MGIGGCHPTVQFIDDEAELVDLVSTVDALSARAAGRNNLLVALFPASKRLGGDAEHLDDGADAVDTILFCRLHIGKYSLPARSE